MVWVPVVLGLGAVLVLGVVLVVVLWPAYIAPTFASGGARQTGQAKSVPKPRAPAAAVTSRVYDTGSGQSSSSAVALGANLTKAQRAIVALGDDKSTSYLTSDIDPIRPSAVNSLELLYDAGNIMNTVVGTPAKNTSSKIVLTNMS